MHRIDTKTAQKDKFGAGKNGFTRGNPQTGTPATDLDDDYFDMLQEELCSVVEASGASLEKGRHDQLLTALRALLLSRKNPFGDIKSDGTVEKALENLGLVDVDSGRLVGPPQIFTSSGTYTPNPKAKRIIVEVQGGGGGGAGTNSPSTMSSASGSGASGAYAKGVFDNPTTQTVTIGSGGTGGVDNPAGNGNAGGQSSFGSLITAVGGNGGQAMTADTGVLSATIAGTVPTVQFTGANIFGRGCGMPGLSVRLSAGVSYSGNGGDSQMGAGGLGSRGQSRGGDGTGPGAGGAGANVNGGVAGSYTGGNGAAGIVIVWEYM
ncbi:carbohydrate kinase [Escherichia coli]|nr:carbohydrate kinase [Escherichia coli]